MDLVDQMRSRVRRHMLTSFGGIVIAILFVAASGVALRSAFGGAPPRWSAVVPMLGILAIPAIGFYSTFKNLRCPSCDRLVAFQVSANFSLFGTMAQKTCPGCNARLFGDDQARRFLRVFLVLFGIGFVLAIVQLVVRGLTHH